MLKNEKAQALVEFIMMMPFVLAFTWYIVHVGMAINKSVVGQKHTRSQLFLKMFNHRHGPVRSDYDTIARSDFFIGISKNIMGAKGTPEAPMVSLGIGASPKLNTEADNEIGEAKPGSLRQNIRVRTAFGICTHRKTLADGQKTDFCGSSNSSGANGGGGGAGGQ